MKKALIILVTIIALVIPSVSSCGCSEEGEVSVFYYTFSDTYFDSGKMAVMDLNPTLAQAEALAAETLTGEAVEVTVTRGNALTVITWAGGQDAQYAWLTMDGELDMRVGEGIWEVTVTNASYDAFQGELSITTMKEDVLTRYLVK